MSEVEFLTALHADPGTGEQAAAVEPLELPGAEAIHGPPRSHCRPPRVLKRHGGLSQVWMPEFRKGRLPGGNPALCPRSGPLAVILRLPMIPLVLCPQCLTANYLELRALPLHLALAHKIPVMEEVTHLAVEDAEADGQAQGMLSPSERWPRRVCAHADDDSIEAHIVPAGERCQLGRPA